MILRYQFYSLCSKWSFYGGVIHVLSQCRCDSSNPFSNHWILPLIILASTLRSALQVFTFPHWSHSSSSKCQASNHSCNRFFLGMSSCFSKSPPQGSIIPLFHSISVLLRPNVLLPNVSPKIYIIVLIALVDIFSFGICWSLGGGAISKKVI